MSSSAPRSFSCVLPKLVYNAEGKVIGLVFPWDDVYASIEA